MKRIARLPVLLTSILSSLLPVAHAAEITRIDARTLHFEGAIVRGDAARLEKMYAPGTTLLKVHSPGGESDEGILLGQFIHAKGMDLEIDRGCGSSCANYMFPAARHKTIPAGAVLAYHGTMYLTDLAGAKDMREQLTASGMPPDEVEKHVPELVAHNKRVARLESEFAATIGVNAQFYRDFKTVAEHGDALYEQYAAQHPNFLWWPSARRLAQCYGIRDVNDQGRPAALDGVGYFFDEKRSLLLVGDKDLPACS
jgi:hypothetical protein